MHTIGTAQDYFILYVDDEEKSLKYFSRYFSKDYKILTAVSSAAAKTILDDKYEQIGVLITDQRMPVEKGVELLKYARQKYPGIVRLLTTAYSDLNDAIEAVNRGEILRYIPKPWDINFLELEIRQALRYFLLNLERDLLRKEKLHVVQRVICCSRAKDLIVFSAGLTHLKNPLHAIRACLLQVQNNLVAENEHSRNYDMEYLIKKDIEFILSLSAGILQTINQNDNLKFIPLDILDHLKAKSASNTTAIQISSQTDNTKIECNQELINKLLQVIIDQFNEKSVINTDGRGITLIEKDSKLLIIVNSLFKHENISIGNLPDAVLYLYLICYHHGGSIMVESAENGSDWSIRLPYRQSEATLHELPPTWLDEILQRYAVLPM